MIESRKENPLISLACNIVIPVLILNKLSVRLGPGLALVLAIASPLAYGLWDLAKTKKANPISILGILNTLITGGFALSGVSGRWFAVKEAAFPLLIGLFVFFSARKERSAVEMLFLNPQLFHIDKLKQIVSEKNLEAPFRKLMTQSTQWLGVSFFFSASLNLALALMIFEPLSPSMDETAKQTTLNSQIATMTQWSMLVILVPSMIFLMAIFFLMVRKLKQMTGLTDDELLHTKS